jgi:hypothetical protein
MNTEFTDLLKEIKELKELALLHSKQLEAIKAKEDPKIPPIQKLAAALDKGESTIRSWMRQQKKNNLGIPFTKDFHYTDESGLNFNIHRCQDWLLCEVDQVEQFTQWRKKILKLEKSRTNRAS